MELRKGAEGIYGVGLLVNPEFQVLRGVRLARVGMISLAVLACALTTPRLTSAQAPPGPMHPVANASSDAADPAGYGDVTRTHRPPPRPATKNDIAGVWKFNQDDSDDILEKLKEARQGSGGRDNGGNGGGNGNPQGGSNPGGIHIGGMGQPYPGTGSGGGNNGAGNPRSRGANGSPSSELSANNPEIEEYTTPAENLHFVMKENEIDLTDDASRQRTYFTDDRRIAKPENQKPSEPKQFDAYWEDVKLVAKEDLPHSVRVTREFEPQQGGMQLIETVTIETNHSNGYVELRLSYDRVGQAPPPAPKTQTAATSNGPKPITSVTTAPGSGSTSSSSDAPLSTVPNASQSSAPSDAPTLKRPTSPQ
ncbi:MAG: hypothetical protein WA823_08225 [Candidatus Acidiferrales bacterium]